MEPNSASQIERTVPLAENLAVDLLTQLNDTHSLAKIDDLSRTIWVLWGTGKISDPVSASLSEAIEARRRLLRGIDTVAVRAPAIAARAKALGRPSHFPPRRRQPVSPDRAASLQRRRLLAASGPMPPTLACKFTTGELAALRIVADEVQSRRECKLTIGEIAARSGVGLTTARNALRQAMRSGLLIIEERRRHLRPNLPNIVRIISRDWLAWIARGATTASKGGGFKKTESTDNSSFRRKECDRATRAQHRYNKQISPPKGGLMT